jgi:hypothetical protein
MFVITENIMKRPVYKCLLEVLYPVSRPITTLDFILLRDNNRALLARSGQQF